MEATRRSWAGTALEDRRRVRRQALLTAGIELLGAVDRSASNVRAVCRAAGLTERYFYESFGDRDTFVRAVYDEVGDRARRVLVDALDNAPASKRADAAVRAFVELMVDEPAAGRVLLLAPLREPAIGRSGVELAPAFVGLAQQQLTAIEDPQKRHMIAVGVVGALTSVFMGYLDGTVVVPRELLVQHCVDHVEHAGRA